MATSLAARSITKRKPPALSALSAFPALPGCDVLGRGYDVFGYYADPRSVKPALFQENSAHYRAVVVEGTTWSVPKDFSLTSVRATEKQTICERTQDEYSSRLAASASLSASFGLFSASVESQFSTSMSTESESYYTSIFVNVYKWKLRLLDDVAALQKKLTPSFKEDLKSLDAMEFFERYGTHFLNEVVVGGRANYLAVTDSKAFDTTSEFRIAAEASYSAIVASASVDADLELKDNVKTFKSNSYTKSCAVGGSAMTDIRDKDRFDAWVESIGRRPVFCAFTNDSLLPISILAESTERRQELQVAAKTFIPVRIKQRVLVGLEVVATDTEGKEEVPYCFTKIDVNVNQGKTGPCIYVCYQKEHVSLSGRWPSDPKPIFNISVNKNFQEAPEPGYRPISHYVYHAEDPNNLMYLSYTTGAGLPLDPPASNYDSVSKTCEIPQLPIRSVCVIYDNMSVPDGFQKLDVNLNPGTGAGIYLCYSRVVDN